MFEEGINEKILKLKGVISDYAMQNESIKQENIQLKPEVADLEEQIPKENKRDNSAAVEAKQAINDASKFDFYRIAIPVVERLEKSYSGQRYTRTAIQNAFLDELERHPQWRENLTLFAVGENGKLRPWAMNALRAKLGDMADTEGGRPPKQRNVGAP